jgi:hypothetical protein
MLDGKTSATSYLVFIHLESFWRIQLKITNHRTNWKEYFAKYNFLDLTQNYYQIDTSLQEVSPRLRP